jgi:Rad3-related DNA helicase
VSAPPPATGPPNLLLAEAGTGIGKTLAYLAPAALWAEQAGGAVWVSTFTKALQRQLVAEGPKLFADADERARKIVVRKGRENYLCLLNLEDALQGAFAGRAAVLAQLVGRWAAYTKDGDMVGGDLPGWLPSLFRRAGSTALTDRRGECVYAGCPHYRRCFVERAERASREADLVIANHALVMINAARARGRARADSVRRGPSSVRRRGLDLRGDVRGTGGHRIAPLDRGARGPLARAAARARRAVAGRRFVRRRGRTRARVGDRCREGAPV